jgi:hypothetical protein
VDKRGSGIVEMPLEERHDALAVVDALLTDAGEQRGRRRRHRRRLLRAARPLARGYVARINQLLGARGNEPLPRQRTSSLSVREVQITQLVAQGSE